jgi:hypothetical protein
MWISSGPWTTEKATVGTGGTAKGSLSVMSSDTAIKATAGPTAATVFGIACAAYDAAAIGDFYAITGETVIGSKYTGSSKTSLTDADLQKVFDISSDVLVNLDDTTGGCCRCVGYDNANSIIFFKVVESFLK